MLGVGGGNKYETIVHLVRSEFSSDAIFFGRNVHVSPLHLSLEGVDVRRSFRAPRLDVVSECSGGERRSKMAAVHCSIYQRSGKLGASRAVMACCCCFSPTDTLLLRLLL